MPHVIQGNIWNELPISPLGIVPQRDAKKISQGFTGFSQMGFVLVMEQVDAIARCKHDVELKAFAESGTDGVIQYLNGRMPLIKL